jgi:hypothetical protein
VNGNFNPGRSLAMFPPGSVSRVPFQYPLKSGCPSAARGAASSCHLFQLRLGYYSTGQKHWKAMIRRRTMPQRVLLQERLSLIKAAMDTPPAQGVF